MTLMLKLLFLTAIRVGELVNIELADLDLATCEMFANQDKESNDRSILFPQTLGLVFRAHLAVHPQQVQLFKSQRCGPDTVRRVQQIVQRYREAAERSATVRPHPFHHQMLLEQSGAGKRRLRRYSAQERAWARLPADLPERPDAVRCTDLTFQ